MAQTIRAPRSPGPAAGRFFWLRRRIAGREGTHKAFEQDEKVQDSLTNDLYNSAKKAL
ncbi:MAG: hypothetical protein HSCHL_1925 [Hydrogenibacillus schlegelii]|uniref:Uncharacterized protein n=1 Tax=Hydrogenibacillus schlegelii TaxID=1484 RepID=A0A2T5GFL7_HYDSH|nr:MAG: hypothetical protein HSCHL_1925 [Hydrogenibacillus schlegelii]